MCSVLPRCTAWIDSLNGIAHHLAQNIDVAIVAAANPATLRAHARKRGWGKLRLLSSGESTFKYDLGSEDREGNQDSTISIFTRDRDGTLRHFTVFIHGWPKTSWSVASMSTFRFGISLI